VSINTLGRFNLSLIHTARSLVRYALRAPHDGRIARHISSALWPKAYHAERPLRSNHHATLAIADLLDLQIIMPPYLIFSPVDA